MLKNYYDCSNNRVSNTLHSVKSFGPKENDIMHDLCRYAGNYGFNRVSDYKLADIIITNTFYSKEVLEWSELNNIPKVKRMDGIYWRKEFDYKNKLHIDAGYQSDFVIFISNYSKNTLKELYDVEYDNDIVILNNSEDYNPDKKESNQVFKWISSCSNWEREGKRLSTIIAMSKIFDNDLFYLIGECDIEELPENIIKYGYIDDRTEMCNLISMCDAFISPFFRDAGSKVTCQAVKCKLPILYTSSGGLPELVNGNGVMINDFNRMCFLKNVPSIRIDNVINGVLELKDNYNYIVENYKERESYEKTISDYFKIMKKSVNKFG